MKLKIVAIIQARMGSLRMPGKVLKPILGKPMLWHVVERVKRAKLINQVVVATSTNPEDKKLVDFCKTNNIEVFKGSENDVLDRYYQCAKKYHADFIVRITADCPLIDPSLIKKLILVFKGRNLDYLAISTGAGVSHLNVNKYPQGLDCEIFTFPSLSEAWKKARKPFEREHVTPFIWTNKNLFKTNILCPKVDYSALRLTVDWPEDLELVKEIYKRLYKFNDNFNLSAVINLLEKKSGIASINSKYLGKTTERFWRQKLMSEFKYIELLKKFNINSVDALVVLSAEEIGLEGENAKRIRVGLSLARKINKDCKFIFLGTKTQNKNLKNYFKKDKLSIGVTFPTNRKEASTRTQIKDLASFVKKHEFSNIMIISHAYHIPRITRYCKRYFDEKNKVYFWPVGNIQKQKRTIEVEIKKIVKYSAKGDIPLFI